MKMFQSQPLAKKDLTIISINQKIKKKKKNLYEAIWLATVELYFLMDDQPQLINHRYISSNSQMPHASEYLLTLQLYTAANKEFIYILW